MQKKCDCCNGTGIGMDERACWHCVGKGYNDVPEKPGININIISQGIWPIPDEAKKCPVCGQESLLYILEDKWEPPYLKCQQAIIDRDYYVQKYPTFTCDKCQTIWQYLGEKEEEKE